MSSRPRRSRRAPKKFTDFSHGDVVEIIRNGVPVQARLAQLLSESASPNPRWLLKFDGQSIKDEEVYQQAFSKKLVSATSPSSSKRGSNSDNSIHTDNDSMAGGDSTPPSPETKLASDDVLIATKMSINSNSTDEDDEEGSTSAVNSGVDDHQRLLKEQARVSAREARSRRRQAKVVQESKQLSVKNIRGGFRAGLAKSNGKRQREEGEECVKVPLLTGTLYLYRGRTKRRAEFVRRV
ncbi:hypothetical protein MPSEU_001069300 [Mayamaea pseudoterrestris]|nr:hypothetical protein MPSEU_001069300 [Mayamaea pseudoterrestris]